MLFLNKIQNNLSQKIKLTQENARVCSSFVGKAKTKQKIRLDRGCENSSTPLHEVMHALGWWHEQQRYARYQSLLYVFSIIWICLFSADRHNHIKIWPERCSWTEGSFKVNFGSIGEKFHDDGTPYDFGSIMHYNPISCAKNRAKPVITKLDGSPITLTKTDTFSKWDIEQINQVYKCKGLSNMRIRSRKINWSNNLRVPSSADFDFQIYGSLT